MTSRHFRRGVITLLETEVGPISGGEARRRHGQSGRRDLGGVASSGRGFASGIYKGAWLQRVFIGRSFRGGRGLEGAGLPVYVREWGVASRPVAQWGVASRSRVEGAGLPACRINGRGFRAGLPEGGASGRGVA